MRTRARGSGAAGGIRAELAPAGIAVIVLALAMGGFAVAGGTDGDGTTGRDGARSAALALAASDGTTTSDEIAGAPAGTHGDDSGHAHDSNADSSAAHGHDGTGTGAHGHDDTGTAAHGHAGIAAAEHADHPPAAHPAGAHADSHAGTHAAGTPAHDHGSSGAATTPTTAHGDHGHGPGATTPGSTTPGSGGTTPTTHGGGGHSHGTTTTLPSGVTTTTQPGATTTTTVHHHDGPNVQLADLPASVQAEIDRITTWAMQYDTTAKATAAGYPQLTRYFPGIAAHYVDLGRLFDSKPFDVDDVEVLLFNGTGRRAQLVGINYIVYSGAQPPAGFAGDFDVWHEHPTLCLDANAIVVSEVPRGATCGDGLTTFPFDGFWLLHVWSIPGWESPEGIFSHENSRV